MIPLGTAFRPDLVIVSAGERALRVFKKWIGLSGSINQLGDAARKQCIGFIAGRPCDLCHCQGFDSALGDPLGGFGVTPNAFAHMTRALQQLAGGRVVLALEGGYNLMSISASAAACVQALVGRPLPDLVLPRTCHPKHRRTIDDCIEIHQQFLLKVDTPGTEGAGFSVHTKKVEVSRRASGSEVASNSGGGGGGAAARSDGATYAEALHFLSMAAAGKVMVPMDSGGYGCFPINVRGFLNLLSCVCMPLTARCSELSQHLTYCVLAAWNAYVDQECPHCIPGEFIRPVAVRTAFQINRGCCAFVSLLLSLGGSVRGVPACLILAGMVHCRISLPPKCHGQANAVTVTVPRTTVA